ncbi:MAG: hypothetical protein FWH19_05640 [Treponema sp.]|nr:hypothetical protein [Treponema sp.]
MMRELSEAECRAAIETGDFDAGLVSGPAAAVILTQSWCPQWAAMKAYLPKAEETLGDVKIYYVEYDTASWESLENEAFMSFKEDGFKNREIPYVRYYRNGVFSRDGNFISADGFLSRLKGE